MIYRNYNKYAFRLEGWQEVIDMYADQVLQKNEEEERYKEQYWQQKACEEREAERSSLEGARPQYSEETEHNGITTGADGSDSVIPLSTISRVVAQTQMESNTGIVATPVKPLLILLEI